MILSAVFFISIISILIHESRIYVNASSTEYVSLGGSSDSQMKLRLGREATEAIQAGEIVQAATLPIEGDMNGQERIFYIQEINAPPSIIWDIILNFNNSVKLRLFNAFLQVEYYTQNFYYPKLQSLVSTLDTSKKHNVKSMLGLWYVVEQSSNTNNASSRVYYSVDLVVLSWLPSFLSQMINEKIVYQSMTWVKIEAEQQWNNMRSKNPLVKLLDKVILPSTSTAHYHKTLTSNGKFGNTEIIDESNQDRHFMNNFNNNEQERASPKDSFFFTSDLWADQKNDPLARQLDGLTWILFIMCTYITIFYNSVIFLEKTYAYDYGDAQVETNN